MSASLRMKHANLKGIDCLLTNRYKNRFFISFAFVTLIQLLSILKHTGITPMLSLDVLVLVLIKCLYY